jgi:catechol 2,3-dioxygenase-like lactoylglutathione lyase family enzyme
MVDGMTLTHVRLLSVPVSDQDRAKEFYTGALGMEVVADTVLGPGMRWLMVRPPGGQTSITLVTWFDAMPPGSVKGLVLETDDLEGDIKALRTRGATIEGEIETAPWGRFVTFDDPDGNGIVLQSSHE